MSKRKKYSPEYKREAIELVRRTGTSCRQVALEIGVAPPLLTCWVREAQPGVEKAFPGTGSPRDEELARLKRSPQWPLRAQSSRCKQVSNNARTTP